jgi:hypothetical protein
VPVFFFDIWWLYNGANTRPDIMATMNQYSEFFRFDDHAHFVSFIVHIAALFDNRRDTISLPRLVREAQSSTRIPATTVDCARPMLTRALSLSGKVAILRHNLFAHRSASLSYGDAFRQASVTVDELRELTETAMDLVNQLLVALGEPEQLHHTFPRDDAVRLLDALGTPHST